MPSTFYEYLTWPTLRPFHRSRMSLSEEEAEMIREYRLSQESSRELDSLRAARETLLRQISAIEARIATFEGDDYDEKKPN